MVILIRYLAFLTLLQAQVASAYVFNRDANTGEPVRLNVTPESPKVYFRISGEAPAFTGKEKFLEGRYASLSDSDFLKALVIEAFKKWNDVEDAYVELVLSAEPGTGIDPADKINNIRFASGSWSDAGSAMPTTGEDAKDSRYILDCDISLDVQKDPEELAFVVLHEVGHCLGLLHPHYSTKSVMSYASPRKFELTLDDVAGLTVLYPVSYEKRKYIVPVCGDLGRSGGSSRAPATALLLMFLPLLLVRIRRYKNV